MKEEDKETQKALENIEKIGLYSAEELLLDYSGMMDMQADFVAFLGANNITLRDVLKYKKGSVIDLNKPAGEPVEVYINSRIIGRGEVMVYDKNLAIRLNEILDSRAVLEYFSKEKAI